MATHSSAGDILLDLTLVTDNLIISYDAAHYHNIIYMSRYTELSMLWYAVSAVVVVTVNNNRY